MHHVAGMVHPEETQIFHLDRDIKPHRRALVVTVLGEA